MSDRLVMPKSLEFGARLEFTTNASRVIDHAHAEVVVDCAAIAMVDDTAVGMLVWLTRNARRRGLSVVLECPTPALVYALEGAGVSDRFTIRTGLVGETAADGEPDLAVDC